MNFRKIMVIAAREYIAVVRSKAFLISLVALPLMMFGSIAIQQASSKVKDLGDRTFAVVDRSPGQFISSALEADVQRRNATVVVDGQQRDSFFRLEKVSPAAEGAATDEQRLGLSQDVHAGKLTGFVEIGGEVVKASSGPSEPNQDLPDSFIVRYQSNNPTFYQFRQLVFESVNRAVQARRLSDAGVSPRVYASISAPVPVVDKGLARIGSDGRITYSAAGTQVAGFMVPFGLSMLMFVVIIVGAVPLLQGVVEEKQQRIAEVLLGSVRPFELMSGKVAGMVGTSATLILLYLAAAWWAMQRAGLSDYLPMWIIPWFLVFQILAVLIYGSLYIAIGASVNEPKELQSLIMPVNLIAVLPIILLGNIIQNPNNRIALIGTWFPFSSPIVTIARMSIPPGLPIAEVLGAIAVVLVTTIVLVYAAGRIFRVGILMQGKPPKIADLIRWAIRG